MSVEEGKKYLEENEFEKAYAIFEEQLETKLALKTLNAWGEDVNAMGDALYKKKNYAEALMYYEQSIELMEKAGNSRKVDNYTKELMSTTEKLAQQINNEADGLLRSKKYSEAVDLYFKSIEMMSRVGKDKKIKNFKGELITALTKLAEYLLDQAESSIKQGKDEEALSLIDDANTRAKMTYDEKIITNIQTKSRKVYEKIAEAVNNKGDDAYKQKNWAQAIKFYSESVRLVKKSLNEKKIAKFQDELKRAFSQNAEEINKTGDKLYKSGDYEGAVEIYQQSVDAAESSGNQKQKENFQAELEKSFEKLSQKVNDAGDKLFKEKKYEEAAKNYVRSIQLAMDAKNGKMVEKFTKELRSTYEKWSQELTKEASELIKKGNYELAIEKLAAAIDKMETTGDTRKIEKTREQLNECYENWAQNKNSEGDSAYKMKDYEKAYEMYEESVQLANLAKNPKLVKNYRKERDRAMRKM
ncbi:MAG: tetratricopeptide repeat protein [Promethearchaeota archaeon]|nr:MAG: tetratricopeptide repeat protein [Candidatus Lokiarchaeota archaeon]